MPIDQSDFGGHIAQMMEAIDNDPAIGDEAEITAIITVVEISEPGLKPEYVKAGVRLRTSEGPYRSVGILETAQLMLLDVSFGGEGVEDKPGSPD